MHGVWEEMAVTCSKEIGVDRKHHSGLMRYRDTCMAREGWSIAWCTITLND